MSSSDGFCSNLSFSPGELGQVYTGHVPTVHHPSPAISAVSSSQPTAVPTPTTSCAPPFEKQIAPPSGSSFSPAPSASLPSPGRTNSSASVPSSQMHTPTGAIASNPTPTLGNVPNVIGSNYSFTGLPWTTPPQTPMYGAISAASSVSGSVLGKRDTSESEKEEPEVQPKKRRIAPTLVSNNDL